MVRIRIGKFDDAIDDATGQVPVTFSHAGVTHRRKVRACLDSDGQFDPVATRVRVDEVALGVAQKIDAGNIT